MPGRITTRLIAAALAGFVACAACSPTTRYRVLSFFLDGVPPAGSVPATKTSSGSGRPDADGGVEAPAPAAPVRFFAHTPYRDNRCGGCHDTTSGQLVRPIEEGLCLTCHSSLVAEARFVHGPVVVSDCTTCHHHHTSPYPNLLLKDTVATCLQCHDEDDLAAGEHHASIGQRSCVDCHNPHSGEDRFFLKRSAP